MLVELVAQPHCLYLLCTEALKYVYTILPSMKYLQAGNFKTKSQSKFVQTLLHGVQRTMNSLVMFSYF